MNWKFLCIGPAASWNLFLCPPFTSSNVSYCSVHVVIDQVTAIPVGLLHWRYLASSFDLPRGFQWVVLVWEPSPQLEARPGSSGVRCVWPLSQAGPIFPQHFLRAIHTCASPVEWGVAGVVQLAKLSHPEAPALCINSPQLDWCTKWMSEVQPGMVHWKHHTQVSLARGTTPVTSKVNARACLHSSTCNQERRLSKNPPISVQPRQVHLATSVFLVHMQSGAPYVVGL